ncbi:hypothetical protein KKF91_01060 [Myxococcota bacterium]|nr:hypothetical protein [Myxococcota bacterium]
MGLLSWLLPSPADKIAKAKRLLDEDRFADARGLVADLEGEEAAALLRRAHEGLVRLNLAHALSFCRAGNEAQVEHHLSLAERFDDGQLEAEFEAFEAEAAAVRRGAARGMIFKALAEAAKRRVELGPDPGDFSWVAFNGDGAIQLVVDERSPLGLPRLVVQPDPAFFKPIVVEEGVELSVEAAAEALRAAYPAALRPAFEGHAQVLGQATLAMLAAAPERAVRALLATPEDNPALRLELARAAAALGVHAAADELLTQFEALHKGHAQIGQMHTAQLQAATAAWLGDHARALRIIEPLAAEARGGAGHLYAAVAINTGALEPARAMIQRLYDRDASDPRLPQLGTAWALEQTAAGLREKYPMLKGQMPEEIEAQAKQLAGIQADFQPLLEAATAQLPSLDIEWRPPEPEGELNTEDEEEA